MTMSALGSARASTSPKQSIIPKKDKLVELRRVLGDAFAGMRHTWVHTKLRTSGAASPACPPRLPRVGRARRGGRRAVGGMLTSEGPWFEPGQSIMRSL